MKIINTAILAIGLAMTLAAENLPPAWREFLDPPKEYAAFKRSARRVVVHERPDYTVEVYEQANGPKTTQRVFVAVPKGVRGRMPAVVAPFYFPEAMLGEDPATGGVECPYALPAGSAPARRLREIGLAGRASGSSCSTLGLSSIFLRIIRVWTPGASA